MLMASDIRRRLIAYAECFLVNYHRVGGGARSKYCRELSRRKEPIRVRYSDGRGRRDAGLRSAMLLDVLGCRATVRRQNDRAARGQAGRR